MFKLLWNTEEKIIQTLKHKKFTLTLKFFNIKLLHIHIFQQSLFYSQRKTGISFNTTTCFSYVQTLWFYFTLLV